MLKFRLVAVVAIVMFALTSFAQ
ncbi:MAG: hypothetical protein RLZZ595_2195, partial [Bacteroidota bacterium]